MFDTRLWNSTLAEDYPKVDKVNIVSNARIIIPSSIIVQQNNLTDDYTEVCNVLNIFCAMIKIFCHLKND